ncbi:MAG: hypothetical protein CVU06_09260 [Bacteroidetes bacterium HGW-Bacteroidetes-22]|nr:MAG: hypothetical protein CVU06_09260 [Bacteroidetes bacterium HGW-Bacteroidetes-22]
MISFYTMAKIGVCWEEHDDQLKLAGNQIYLSYDWSSDKLNESSAAIATHTLSAFQNRGNSKNHRFLPLKPC